MRVGFIGLGSQGAPMARRIVDGGYGLTLWARRPESLEAFAGTAAEVAGSPAELAAASDLVCLCVVNDADVDGLVDGDEGLLAGLRPGGIIAVHSTVHPDTCRALAERAAAHGVSVIDAPVSGGAPAAEKGSLLVMVGGDDVVVEKCRPVFETYADPVIHLGPVGAGQVTKILNNLLFSANLGAAMGTLELGEALGVPRDRLCQVITRGSANSRRTSGWPRIWPTPSRRRRAPSSTRPMPHWGPWNTRDDKRLGVSRSPDSLTQRDVSSVGMSMSSARCARNWAPKSVRGTTESLRRIHLISP